MKTILKPISKAAMAVIAIAVFFSACKKETENESLLRAQMQASVLSCDTLQYTYISDTAAPTGTFDPIYLNVATGAQSYSPFLAATVMLNANVNSTINLISGVSTIKYLNSSTAICDLTVSDWNNATDTTSLGKNTNGSAPWNGYFHYPFPPDPSVVPDFYVLVQRTSTGDIYAIKYREILGHQVTNPPNLTVSGAYKVTVRKIN